MSQGVDTYNLFLVHTQAMYVERLDIRCPPYGDSVMEAALACGVHPLPDSTGRVPTCSSVLQLEMTRVILQAVPWPELM